MKKRISILLLILFALLNVPSQSHATESTIPEAVSFYSHSKTAYVGLSEILSVYFTPEGADEAYTMSSSDETIVRLEYQATFDHYTAYYLKPGAAVITVTSESGLSDQCTVTVMEMEAFALNETKTVTVQPEEVLTFEFEYEEYGDYVFFSTSENDAWVKSETKDANIYYNLNRHYFTLDENSEFCRVSIYNDTESTQTYTVKLMKAVPVESISLNVSRPAPYYVGDWVRIEAELHPENAKQEELTWASSNNSIVALDYWTWKEYSADFLSVGNAAVTVTSESGTSVSLEMTVISPEQIEEGCTLDITLDPKKQQKFFFTPKESGKYIFYSPQNEEYDVLMFEIFHENGEIICQNYDDARIRKDDNGTEYFCSFYTLESGVTYTLEIHNYDETTRTDTLHINKAVTATHISFLDQPDSVYFVRDALFMKILVSPIYAEPQELSFSISDSNVAYVKWTVDYGALWAFTHSGTATLTASTQNNLSVACDVTVKYPNLFTDVSEGSFYYDPVMWAVEESITNGLTADTFGPTGVCNRAQVVTFLWRANGSPEPTTTEHNFVDVSETAFYYKAMLWAVENGITTGTDTTHFSPNAACNRATVVTFLWRAEGNPEPASTNNPFTDVKTDSWYGKAVLWAVENSITNGIDAAHFGPTTDCNRATVVTFLYRAYND